MPPLLRIHEHSLGDDSSTEWVAASIREDKKSSSTENLTRKVATILSEVERFGDDSLLRFSRKFDGTDFRRSSELLVREEEFAEAKGALEEEKLRALKSSLKQIRWLTRRQKNARFGEKKYRTPFGYMISEYFIPLARVGGYVPGGLASYPSTVLMTCGPALEAGVKDIVLATPPGKDGRINAGVLVAAQLCGVKEVIKLGGAHAVAALAYGTKSIRRVDLIAGPGNKYVTEAKRQVSASNLVLIDALAGPTELLVVANTNTNPEFVAEDIISQAEHGNRTLCGVVSDSEIFLSRVKNLIERQDKSRKRFESIRQSTIFLVKARDKEEALSFAEAFAPEHLEVLLENNAPRIISRSGLTLVGEYSPCSASDYAVGTDHILPTGGTASRTSGVSVETFLKRVQTVKSTPSSLKKSLRTISTLSLMEGLPNHARAAEIRFMKKV